MILFLSRIADDTTVSVIEWIIYSRKDFRRINVINEMFREVSFNINEDDLSFSFGNKTVEGSDVSSLYFMGGGNQYAPPEFFHQDDKRLNEGIANFLANQAQCLFRPFFQNQKGKKVFGLSPFDGKKINKLQVLMAARQIGLYIPDSMVVSTKDALRALKLKWGSIINKSIDDGINISADLFRVSGQQTIEVTDEIIDNMEECFFPSLIQRNIKKEYEVRTYYFDGRFRSIAQFTQNNERSRIDGRQIDPYKPIRQVPFQLPKELEEKVTRLMKNVGLNYGSLDFIYGKDEKYYFLEVNPYGQIGFLSTSGNYYLEKEIADYL